jgi:hypothetical protein
MIKVNGESIASHTIQAIEPVYGQEQLPFAGMGIAIGTCAIPLFFFFFGSWLCLLPGVMVVGGMAWWFYPWGTRYGWKIHRFHEPALIVWFNTSAASNAFLKSITAEMPNVQILTRVARL